VSRKETGIDDDAMNASGKAESDDGPIVAGSAPPARLPAVHPLSALGIDSFSPFGGARLDQPFLRREELVVSRDDRAAKALAGKIDEFRELECRVAHDGKAKGSTAEHM